MTHQPVHDRSAHVLGITRMVSGGVTVLGLILVVGATPGTGTLSWPIEVVGAGATLAAAGLATFVALLGIKTYRDQKREDADAVTLQARSRVYEEIVAHVVRSFIGGSPAQAEAVVRAQAATWASPETLRALADWFRFASAQSGRRISLPDRGPHFELVYRIVTRMREDLYPGSSVAKDDVLRMMFNDYSPVMHDEGPISSMKVLEDGQTDWPARPWPVDSTDDESV